MIIKEYTAKDTTGKNRIFAEVKCEVCTSIFVRQKRQLKDRHTCSRTCTNIATGSLVELKCDHCGSDFTKAKSKLSGSKSGKYFCSRSCKDSAQRYMVEIQPNHYGTVTGITCYREKAFKYFKPICSSCGFNIKAALDVHHKDRNRENNELDNLEILCANCHRIEHLGH
jgi:hypothetical protein